MREVSRTEKTKRKDAEQVSFLDQTLWKHLGEASTPKDIAKSWLPLQCRMIPEVSRGVVVLGEPDTGPFTPAAYWPEGESVRPELMATAEAAMAERRGVVQGHMKTEPRQQDCNVAFPFLIDDKLHGVVAIGLEGLPETQLRAIMRQLQWGAAWIELVLRRRQAEDDRTVSERTTAALDLVATALEETRFRAACESAVTELATRLDCDRVSIGFPHRGHMSVAALSHSANFGKRMNLIRAIGSAMDEAVDQMSIVHYPPSREGDNQVTRAHAELARAHGAASILTIPLTAGDLYLGALTFERPARREFDQATIELCECVASVIGLILDEKRRNDRLIFFKIAESILLQLEKFLGPSYLGRKMAAALVLALVAFFTYAKGEYRITSQATLEGLVQRSIVAPFDGYILSEQVRAEDTIRQGAALAALDDNDLAIERQRWVSRRQQHRKEFDRALAEGDRADINIINAQIQQAAAQVALLDEQISRAKLVAPFDGLVVSGDLSQSVGASVERGQVLFEITPLNSYRVILKVDESDISQIEVGQTGSLVMSSIPNEPFRLTIEMITPVAEAQEGLNYFRVEAKLNNISERLRPGMEGVGKIQVDRRRLIWIWTHKLIDWLRLMVWVYWP